MAFPTRVQVEFAHTSIINSPTLSLFWQISSLQLTHNSMAYDNELVTDLIQKVQQATRAEAGLSHYDPTRKPLPPLPSISESVTYFDPAPPNHLRCRNCKGGLLRGLQSLICVYCGRPNDVVPDLISFKDTLAYSWLLESLHLDGSETVGPPSEKGDLKRGQSTPKVEISLSELLDFKITWPVEEEKGENVSNKKPVEWSYKKLTGFNLDNFFHESRRTDSSNAPKERPVTSNGVVTAEIKGPTTHHNLSCFENVKLSESAVQPSTYKNNGAFSGWEADFQPANFGDHFGDSNSFDPGVDSSSTLNLHEISKLPNPSNDSTVDSSSQLEFVFEPSGESKNERSNDGSVASPSIGDWTSDHLWNNSKMEAFVWNEQPDPAVRVNDALPEDNMSNVDLSLQLDSIFEPVKDSKDGNEKEDSATSPSINDWTSDEQWNNVNKEAAPQAQQRDATVGVKDAFPQDNASNLSTSLDWFQVNQLQNNASASANNLMSGDEGLFDDWNDFTYSTHVQDSSQTAPTHSHEQSISASECTLKLNLSSSDNNLEDMDFGSFSQADPLPRSSSKGSVFSEMHTIGLDVSTPDRVIDTKTNTGEGVGKSATSGDTNVAFDQSRENVQLLLSKMHDLSFMLENNLSLPPKSEGFDSFP
ncbi:hypothetical protein ACH5RR_032397 [Cinchona calisaya]|uniref:DUF7815 domain-containing protein n=1 Tax=Cinchona calisaya TaxID=153742 RepID=A0ABD2YLG5_9GENT